MVKWYYCRMKAAIALVDDHVLMRNGLATLLQDLGYTVAFEASNGQQFIQKIGAHALPQVVLMDINMPVMDGFATTQWIKQHHPSVKVLALSMLDDEAAVVKMIRKGAKGFILKDCEPDELEAAIQSVLQKDFYLSEVATGKLVQALSRGEAVTPTEEPFVLLSDKEVQFLHHICTDLSYKEIATQMGVSPRTVDGYRDALYEKLDVKTRVALALFAVKKGIVKV
jgi:two-component system invasion response regulator UvrY